MTMLPENTGGEQMAVALLTAVDRAIRPESHTLGLSCLIGRDATCDVVVPQAFQHISRVHALITRKNGYYFLTDRSKNGTFINGKRLDDMYQLQHNDRIGLGELHSMLLFTDLGSTTLTTRKLRYMRAENEFYFCNVAMNLPRNGQALLRHLYENAGRYCNGLECAKAIWGRNAEWPDRSNQLYKEINELRTRFKAIAPQSNIDDLLQTRRIHGYRLNLENDDL